MPQEINTNDGKIHGGQEEIPGEFPSMEAQPPAVLAPAWYHFTVRAS
jgi:hypothetical protein